MNKQDCLNASAKAAEAAARAKERFAAYLQTFGGKDALTTGAEKELQQAVRAESERKRIADWHPQSRNKALRNRSLPAYLFGFVA